MTFNRASCGVEKLVKSQNITRKGEINSVNKASQVRKEERNGLNVFVSGKHEVSALFHFVFIGFSLRFLCSLHVSNSK